MASPEADAWSLLEAAADRRRTELLIERSSLTPEQQLRFDRLLARREAREPLQLILGHAHFYGLRLEVRAGVLVPRPETERLVELTLERLRYLVSPRVLDVGTGSGAVALALKSERPDAALLGTDVSPAALELARANALRLGLDVSFCHADLMRTKRVAEFAGAAHAVVCNPPYLPAADRRTESPELASDPDSALYAGEDGLAVFRRLEAEAYALLPSGAWLLVELDPRNVRHAQLSSGEWAGSEIHEDLAGRQRFLALRR